VCVCGCGADRGGWSSSGCGLVAGWCVCVMLGWWVRSPSRLLLRSYKAMRALQAAGQKKSFIFAVKHNEKAIDNKLYICYLFNYIRLYPTISHHIPPYLTISHHILPYPTITKPGYPKDIRQRGLRSLSLSLSLSSLATYCV